MYDEYKSRSFGRNASKRAVSQYDLEGNLIATYNSITEASVVSGISDKLISKSALTKNRSTIYQWRYVDDAPPGKFDKPKVRYNNKSKRINQFDFSGNLLKTYRSLTEAMDATGIDKTRICANCNARRHSAGGYVWRYAA